MDITRKGSMNKGQNYRSPAENMSAMKFIALKAGLTGWKMYLKRK